MMLLGSLMPAKCRERARQLTGMSYAIRRLKTGRWRARKRVSILNGLAVFCVLMPSNRESLVVRTKDGECMVMVTRAIGPEGCALIEKEMDVLYDAIGLEVGFN
jgi:hypothetical protein